MATRERKESLIRRRASRAGGLALVLVLVVPSTLRAQVPLDGCIDRANRPVRSIVRNDMVWAGVATVEKGESVIYWNQRRMGGRSRPTQIFVYLHECGHHLLGHVWKANDARWEQEADCWAVQRMWEGGMIAGRHLRVLEEELSRTRGDAIHLGGEQLLAALKRCLEIKTDRRAWAAALARFIEAAADSFASIRGQPVPTPASRSGGHESLADPPGTYDCEVTAEHQVRCTIFAARDGERVAERFEELARIIPAALPAGWHSAGTDEPPAGAVRELVVEDTASGLEITLVSTPAHRIVFTMGIARTGDDAADVAMLAPDPVPFRAEPAVTPGGPEVQDQSPTAEAPDTVTPPPAPRPRDPSRFVLHQGVLVRIKVPALGSDWIRARAAQTASATPCLLFELDISRPDGQKRYAMLRGVTALEVDARMWDGPVVNLSADGARWTEVSLDRVRGQDAGCRR
ncbi:MAG TPA: hypothetical protein VFZ13_15340 [Gemmatimonadales bacterium]